MEIDDKHYLVEISLAKGSIIASFCNLLEVGDFKVIEVDEQSRVDELLTRYG